jgi:ceramide glucosyltransferase
VVLTGILITLSAIALLLLAWQWLAARRFPMHRREINRDSHPDLTMLKPLKGADAFTEDCLRSWFAQDYPGKVQILFAVASEQDPAVAIVQKLIAQFTNVDASLVVCRALKGANVKVAKLAQIETMAKYPVLVISDADVAAPADLLTQLVLPLRDQRIGLVNCFYTLRDACNLPMRWEAVATDADFWSQVLQSNSLKPMDFALGAVMAVRRECLQQIGGFLALADCLADDYQLGHRIAKRGHKIALCPVPVACRNAPMGWGAAWKHQLRWARTIRICQPIPYFFSILSNATLWPLLLVLTSPNRFTLLLAALIFCARMIAGLDMRRRLIGRWTPADAPVLLLKDILHTAVWLMAFLGNTVEWRGRKMLLRKDGSVAQLKT